MNPNEAHGTLRLTRDNKAVLGYPLSAKFDKAEEQRFQEILMQWLADPNPGAVLILPFPVDVIDERFPNWK